MRASCIHQLEGLALFRCPYALQIATSMKSLLLCQKDRKLHPKIYMKPQGSYLPKTI